MANQISSTNQETTSFSVELVSGPTARGGVDDFELSHARRALARLKALLGRQGLLNLLAKEIEEGNAFLRGKAKMSNGEFKSATTVLAVRGIKAAQFVRWLEHNFSNESVLLAAEPEHYVIAPNPNFTVTVVENLGPYICHVRLPAYDKAARLSAEGINELLPESEYPFRRLADLSLPDGTVVGRVLTQFGDTDQGFNANLTCYFPVACPEDIFEHHRQHLAVEFRNWIVAAAAAQR
ncbi:hypothetical protein F0U62_32880 [Cystobacter fuscus]|uniref:hypothetical protein n=1 Tax=Cystobacter fuscus TaxID=43 RepID=UPI002B2BD20B|nr:hypothetical protein F0U62_32880 [Cystobacter fuscus]